MRVSGCALILVVAFSLGCHAPSEHPAPRADQDQVATCNELFDRAAHAVDALLPIDLSCASPSDCIVIVTGGCLSQCATAAIPKSHADEVIARQQAARDKICPEYGDRDCYHVTPRPSGSCRVPSLTCKEGSCALGP
jgi:hypothetical protein